MKKEKHDFKHITDDSLGEIFTCPDCKLYWYNVNNTGLLEFRLFVFTPYNPKKCPFCEDPTKEVPIELIEFRNKK